MDKIQLPNDISLENIHTLESDTAEAITKNNISKAQIFAAQEKKEAERVVVEEKETSSYEYKNIFLMGVLIVVLLGISYGVFIFFQNQSKKIPVPANTASASTEIISYDSVKSIIFSNSTKLYNDAVATSTKGGITFFKLNSNVKDLLLALSPSLPQDFFRSIQDKGFFGSFDGSNFIILSVDSYDHSYAGMLAWEPLMNNDLFPLFGIPPTTSLAHFEDRTLSNRDIRAALDTEGNTLFVWGFYNPQTLIIARNDDTFSVVTNKLLLAHL